MMLPLIFRKNGSHQKVSATAAILGSPALHLEHVLTASSSLSSSLRPTMIPKARRLYILEETDCGHRTGTSGCPNGAEWLRHWTCNSQVASSIPGPALSSNNLGQSCLHPRASAGRSGLAMAWLTAVWEATASYVYHDSHCDVQPWARAAHPSCSA